MEIAYLLGRSEDEILDMSMDTFLRWASFFQEAYSKPEEGKGSGKKAQIHYRADRFNKKGFL